MRAARRDPTTMNVIIKSRPKPRPVVSVEKRKQLEKQFSDLQQQWLKQKPPPPPPSQPTPSSSSASSTTTSEYPFETLFDNSPRSLMSSLQKGKPMVSPDDGWQRRRMAVNISMEEILSERKAAIESGIIKGRRRLFDDSEDEEEEICSSNNFDREIYNHYHHHDNEEEEEEEEIGCCCRRGCCRVSGFHHGKQQVFVCSEQEKKVVEVNADKGLEVINNGGGGKKRRKMMLLLWGWFSVSILVLVMGIVLYKILQIVAAGYDENGDQHVVTLAPT